MHLLAAWDSSRRPDAREAFAEAVRAALAGESFVEPLPGLYIIGIERTADREDIRKRLEALAETHDVDLIISPAIRGGNSDDELYGGWLDSDLWPEINRRTLTDTFIKTLEQREDEREAEVAEGVG